MKKNWKLKLKIVNTEELTLATESNKTQIQYSPFEHDIIEKLMNKQVISNNVILFNLPENENKSDLENIIYIFTCINENILHFTVLKK